MPMTTLLAWVLRVLDAALAVLRLRLRAASAVLLYNQRTFSPGAATSGPSVAAASRELQMDAHAPAHGPSPGGGTCISDLPDGVIEVREHSLSTCAGAGGAAGGIQAW